MATALENPILIPENGPLKYLLSEIEETQISGEWEKCAAARNRAKKLLHDYLNKHLIELGYKEETFLLPMNMFSAITNYFEYNFFVNLAVTSLIAGIHKIRANQMLEDSKDRLNPNLIALSDKLNQLYNFTFRYTEKFMSFQKIDNFFPFLIFELEQEVYEFMQICDFSVTPDDEEKFNNPDIRICHALGLDLNFVKELRAIPEKVRVHQNIQYWILRIIEEKFYNLNETYDLNISKNLLMVLGFSEMGSQALLEHYDAKLLPHRGCLYWVKRFVEDFFQFNRLLNDEIEFPRYPFNPDLKNEEFLQSRSEKNSNSDSDCSSDSTDCLPPVKCFNLDSADAFEEAKRIISDLNECGKYCVFFHGTDHRNGENIIMDCIRLEKNRSSSDFSHQNGFYVCKSLKYSYDWALANKGYSEPAILIFRVEREKLESNSFKGECFCGKADEKEFCEVVLSYRLDKCSKQLRKRLDKKCDYICGPMTRSVNVNARHRTPFRCLEGDVIPIPDSYQLCAKSEKCRNFLDSGLHMALFF